MIDIKPCLLAPMLDILMKHQGKRKEKKDSLNMKFKKRDQ
jgi:hypothetical protein